MGDVMGEGLGVEVLKGSEVIVDGMSHHSLLGEHLQDLALSNLEGYSIHYVLLLGTTPSGVVLHNVKGREDVLIISQISIVVDNATLSQITDMSLRSCALHVTVNCHHLSWHLLGCFRAFIL